MIFSCVNCKEFWRYPIKVCLFCGHKVQEDEMGPLVVHSLTQVDVPSSEHDRVPYYNVLLRDDNGRFFIQKYLHEVNVGDVFSEETTQSQDLRVGIVGTGTMGRGLGALLLQYDYPLVVIGRSSSSLDLAKDQMRKILTKLLDENETESRIKKTIFSQEMSVSADCDLIIESIAEDLSIKQSLLMKLENICSAECVLATNTSSLSITELGRVLQHPDRFLGLHFFNPVSRMQLVEVVRGEKTAQNAISIGESLVNAVGKTPVAVNDSPCFIVNRVLMPFLNEAVRVYGEKVATPEDIDKAVVLGLNHPIGPLALIDLIGIDIFVKIMKNLSKSLGASYDPGQAALDLVAKKHVGRKTKNGFYQY